MQESVTLSKKKKKRNGLWTNASAEAALQRCFRKRCPENMQQICWRAFRLKCDFNLVALKSHFDMGVRSPVNLLHIFRTPSPKNTCGGLLLILDV